MLLAAAIERFYDLRLAALSVAKERPHGNPHKLLLLEIESMLQEAENDFFVDQAGYNNRGGGLHPPSPDQSKEYFSNSTYEVAIHRELEERDYYIEKNVFWVPALARWQTLQDCHARMRSCKMRSHPAEHPRSGGYSARLPVGTEILKERGRLAHSYKITSTGKLIDDALEAVEKENPNLKNVLNKNYIQLQIDPANLAGLIDLIATIPFQHADLHAKDILGHDPNSASLDFASASLRDLCALAVNSPLPRMATGMSPLPDTFTRDQHPDLRADVVMALPSAAARSLPRSHTVDRSKGRINSPFKIKEWWDGKLEGDARWSRSEVESASHAQFYKNRDKYGTPPQSAMRECAPLKSEGIPQVMSEAKDKNANFAWVQHILYHLARNGIAS